MSNRTDRIRSSLWPALPILGLVIVASSQATWGYSDQGVQLEVSGLGGVHARAADAADAEAFFAEYTQRPGLVTLILGAVIFVVGALAWWRPVRANRGAAVAACAAIAAAATATLVLGLVVVADPARKLLVPAVVDAVDLTGPILSAGWGVLITVVAGAVTLFVSVVAGVLRWRDAPRPPCDARDE